MTTFAERLRGVVRPAGVRPAMPAAVDRGATRQARRTDLHVAAEVLGGEWRETAGHGVLVVERVYRPGHRHGRATLADALPAADTPWPGLSLLAGRPDAGGVPSCGRTASDILFVDLETTGLAGGAGTCAFLVGCGWFDGGVFRVRQIFLPSIAAERALLTLVAELAARAGTVVTYNGKSFDLPLIETRFLYHRMETPFAGMPHLDLLHPARRLWRPDPEEVRGAVAADGCRLIAMERTLCGFVREDDVSGFEIPARYFEYVRSGDARPLDAVFEHNRLDLVSLALLTARAAQLVDEGAGSTRTPREALGLGRVYEQAGRVEDALACYRRAASPPAAGSLVADALRASAVLCRRLRRYDDAASMWRRLLELGPCPPQLAREAAHALAVHHEHRLRDPRTARSLALQSLAQASGAAWRQAVQHRVARLDRKLERRGTLAL